jgi:hypothetical protein
VVLSGQELLRLLSGAVKLPEADLQGAKKFLKKSVKNGFLPFT